MNWTSNIDNFESLSFDEKERFQKFMEQAYITRLYGNWDAVKHISLNYIK